MGGLLALVADDERSSGSQDGRHGSQLAAMAILNVVLLKGPGLYNQKCK